MTKLRLPKNKIIIIALIFVLFTSLTYSFSNTTLERGQSITNVDPSNTKQIVVFEREDTHLPLSEVFDSPKDGTYKIIKADKSTDLYLESKFGSLCDTNKDFTFRIKNDMDDFIDMTIQYVGAKIIRKCLIYLLKEEIRIFALPLTP